MTETHNILYTNRSGSRRVERKAVLNVSEDNLAVTYKVRKEKKAEATSESTTGEKVEAKEKSEVALIAKKRIELKKQTVSLWLCMVIGGFGCLAIGVLVGRKSRFIFRFFTLTSFFILCFQFLNFFF